MRVRQLLVSMLVVKSTGVVVVAAASWSRPLLGFSPEEIAVVGVVVVLLSRKGVVDFLRAWCCDPLRLLVVAAAAVVVAVEAFVMDVRFALLLVRNGVVDRSGRG